MSEPPLFKWRHFTAEMTLCAVRWYLRYTLSYRDVEELMQERGVTVDHGVFYPTPRKGIFQKHASSMARRIAP